jgi:hypothetical protein
MATQGTITITSSFVSTPGGSSQEPSYTVLVQNGINAQQAIVLANGFNQITIPAGASEMAFIFPSTSVTTKTLKGVTGDTGIALAPNGPNGPFNIPVGSGATTFGITTSGADTLPTIFYFN